MKWIAILLLWCFSAAAQYDACQARLIKVASVRHFTDYAPSIAIQFESEIPFELGEKLHVVKRIGDFWYSSYAHYDTAPQGDPRLFVLVFGARTAGFFGYRQLAEDLITLPTAEALNKAVETLNHGELKGDPLPVSFYDANGIVEEKIFLERLVNFQFPLSKDSHDHAFHSSMLTIPKADLAFAAQQTKWVLDFLTWGEQKLASRSWYSALRRTLVEYLVHKMDVGSGDVASNIATRSILQMAWNDPHFFKEATPSFELFFNNGKSPDQVLKYFAYRALDEMIQAGFKIEPREKIELNQLIAEFNSSRISVPARADLVDTKENMLAFYKRVNARRGQIAKAVVAAQGRLNSSKPLPGSPE